MIELQTQLSLESNLRDVGKTFEVLIEGFSKRSREQLFGRSQQNKVVVFDKQATASVSTWMYASSPPRQRPSSGSPCALPKAICPKPSKHLQLLPEAKNQASPPQIPPNLWGRCRFTPVVQAALLDYSDDSQCAKENFPHTSWKTAYTTEKPFVYVRGR